MVFNSILAASIIAAGTAFIPAKSFAASDNSIESNVRTFTELYDVVNNGGDTDATDKYFAAKFIDHDPFPGQSADVAGFKAGLADMRKSFPDLRMTLQRTIAQGDLVVAHVLVSGSQLGEFMGAPASGKTFSVGLIDIVRMKDGRIAEHWGVMDAAAMAGQLGLH